MSAIELIEAERQRQIAIEGYSAEHDDEHGPHEFIQAATAYWRNDPSGWPWDPDEFKPKTRERDLIRAGALAMAARDCARRLGGGSKVLEADSLIESIRIDLATLVLLEIAKRTRADMKPPRHAHCCLCGAPRRPTQAPVESFGNGIECISIGEHRELREGRWEESPQMLVAVNMWRNGGTAPGQTHICDDCVVVGLKAAKRFVEDALRALGS